MSDDLDKLAKDLRAEADLTPREVRSVVSRGALNIKRDWRRNASGIEHAPRYPQSIGYDVDRTAFGYEAVIGPESGTGGGEHQGFLGDILEFGGAHNGPRNDGGQALDAEAPRFVKAIEDVAGKRLA
jgi:hypothetical protein